MADKGKSCYVANLCLVQGLQPLFMILLNVFQLLQSLLLLLQGLHVDLLAFHLRKELIHCLSAKMTLDLYYVLAKSVNLDCNRKKDQILSQTGINR